MLGDDFALSSECCVCGREHEPDDGGWATCYGSPEHGHHSKVIVWRPCMICGSYITWAELCSDCAEDNDPFEPRVDPMHARPVRSAR